MTHVSGDLLFPWILTFLGLLVLVAGCYFVIAESRWGRTVGKHLFHLVAVTDQGARVTVGQSIVRQLPTVLQVIYVDMLFALFTEKRQRAFEMLSRTRVVQLKKPGSV
jgi:uncharacterized RDD family membrane protein YckC